MINNIRNNTISEISAKKGLNTLNQIKDAEMIKYKRCTHKQKELLNSFNDLLDTLLTDKTLKSKSQKDNTLMLSKDDNGSDNDNDNDNDNENENDNNIIKQLNDSLDKIIDKSKSFEDQIKLIAKEKNEYWFTGDYHDIELKFKIFKLRLAHLSNIIDKKIFEQIFGHTFEILANKLINTTNKTSKTSTFFEFVIQPRDQHINLIDAINLILYFNEGI